MESLSIFTTIPTPIPTAGVLRRRCSSFPARRGGGGTGAAKGTVRVMSRWRDRGRGSQSALNTVHDKLEMQDFANIASSSTGQRLMVDSSHKLLVPPSPTYIGSQLIWIGVGVGLSAAFSVMTTRLKVLDDKRSSCTVYLTSILVHVIGFMVGSLDHTFTLRVTWVLSFFVFCGPWPSAQTCFAQRLAILKAFKSVMGQNSSQNGLFNAAAFSPGTPFPYPAASPSVSTISSPTDTVPKAVVSVDFPGTKVAGLPLNDAVVETNVARETKENGVSQ